MIRFRPVIFIAGMFCALSLLFIAASANTPPPASRMIDVNIEGAVQKPGVYPLDEHTTIWAAIEAAGGLRKTAVDQILFWRKGPDSFPIYTAYSWKRRAELVPAPIVRDWPNIKIEDDPIPLAISASARIISSTLFHLRKNADGSFEKIRFEPSVALQNLSLGSILVPSVDTDTVADELVCFQLEVRDPLDAICGNFEQSPPRRTFGRFMEPGEEHPFRLQGPFLLSVAAPGKYTATLKVGVQASRHRPEITWITAAPLELSILPEHSSAESPDQPPKTSPQSPP